jgi:hypothetical protein
MNVTQDAMLRIKEDSVDMTGIWPGRYGAVALLVFTHSLDNVMEATLKVAPLLKKMDQEGGQATTQALFETLQGLGADTHPTTPQNSLTPSDMGQSAYIDGREMFEMLEMEALEALSTFGGHLSRGPFVITAKLLPSHLKSRMAMISSKYEPLSRRPE